MDERDHGRPRGAVAQDVTSAPLEDRQPIAVDELGRQAAAALARDELGSTEAAAADPDVATRQRLSDRKAEVEGLVSEAHTLVDPYGKDYSAKLTAAQVASDRKLADVQARMKAVRARFTEEFPEAKAPPKGSPKHVLTDIEHAIADVRAFVLKSAAWVAMPYHIYEDGLLLSRRIDHGFASNASRAAFVKAFYERREREDEDHRRREEEERRQQEDDRRRAASYNHH